MMSNIYPLEWLDSLILDTFNPKKIDVKTLTEIDLSAISENVLKESHKIQVHLKKEIFLLRNKREIRLQVRKYHSNLIYLLDTVIENQKNEVFEVSDLSIVLKLLEGSLEELLVTIEKRFSTYLSLDQRVPITYLMLSRNELQFKLDKLRKKSEGNINYKVLKIIIDNIQQFIKSFSSKKITYRQLLYQKKLLQSIRSTENSDDTDVFSEINKVLIQNNFNSSDYLNYIIGYINDKINLDESLPYQISKLLFIQKEFDRIYSNEKISFDPSRNNIKDSIENWFRHEINYLKNSIELTKDLDQFNSKPTENSNEIDSKIECDLSSDQIALILRASDEARIVKARSMNHVFKMIVPYLSTPFKKDLSYQSVRSKSYNPEERDKEIAIKILEKIITKIQSY